MATIYVNTTIDEQDGSVFDGDTSLRDALAVAAAGDVIKFADGLFTANKDPLNNSVIILTLGELILSQDITIDGDVNGDGIADVTIDGGGADGIFRVDNAGTDVILNSLTLRNGYDANDGGAVDVRNAGATLTIGNSNFVSNTADDGGAIQTDGALTIANSYFGNNTGLVGGAISSGSSTTTIVNSTFTQNAGSYGGAIYTAGGTLDLINSTITGNHASIYGGGIFGGTTNVSNSIVFGNSTSAGGADMAFNTLNSSGNNIFGTGVTGTGGDQILSVFDLPNVFASVGPVTVGGATFDAGLVSNTKGITPTVGIAEGGLAEDAGTNADIPSEADLGFDLDGDGTVETGPLERDGSGYTRIVGGTVDIGASENYGRTWVVDVTNDIDDGDLSTGNLSFREAVTYAQAGDTVLFDSTVFTADDDERTNTSIFLTNGTILLLGDDDVTINGDVNGDGIADVTLDGSGNGTRMLQTFDNSALHIESMTLANADVTGQSGAVIATRGNLTVLNSSFLNNTSSTYGGAIRAYAGSTTIANSTFDGNTAERGGAIRSTATDVQIFNSTFYGNHANDTISGRGGGAIETASGTLTISQTTITGNTAATTGGGVHVTSGTLDVQNSVIVGNGEYSGGTFSTSDLNSLVGGTSNGGNVFGSSNVTAAGDIISAPVSATFDTTATITTGGITLDAGVIASNGGPTDTVLILQGGNAVDQAVTVDVPEEISLGIDVNRDGTIAAVDVDIDQRGEARLSGNDVDAGAVELNRDVIVVTTTEDTSDGDVSADDISWREALTLVADGGTIEFDETVFTVDDDALNNVTIDVANGTEGISKSVTINGDINGDGRADVTFDGTSGGLGRWLEITGSSETTLVGVTVSNFSSGGSGGAIRAASNNGLQVHNSNFIGNETNTYAGAIRNYSPGTLIMNSYFADNSSTRGGAIRTTADLTIIGSTFTGNHTTSNSSLNDGGAIDFGGGTLTILNSTITGNFAADDGGGVGSSGGTLVIQNSIIAGNSAGVSDNDVTGVFTSGGVNIFGEGQTGAAVSDVVLDDLTLAAVFDSTGEVIVGGSGIFEAGLVADNGGDAPSVGLNVLFQDNPALDAADTSLLNEAVIGIDVNGDGDMTDQIGMDGRGFGRSLDIPSVGTQTTDVGAFEVQISTSSGGDVITGTTGGDTLNGSDGNDFINGGGGSDLIYGGNGSDTASYQDATNDVSVYLQYTGIFVGGGQGADTLINIENLTGGDFNDRLIGNSSDNYLNGGMGNDTIKGKDGNDFFDGGDGDDIITGGSGDDFIDGGAGSDTLFALAGNDFISGGDDRDFVYGGRDTDVVYGDGGDDEVRGNLGNDILFGGEGIDDLRGGGNNDFLFGEDDNDFLFGENGADTLSGGAGNDAMSGGAGGGVGDGFADTFIYADTGSGGGGFDRIKDMEDGIDLIDLTAFGFASFGDISASSAGSGTATRLDFGAGETLYIENFAFGLFDASDVLL